MYEPKLWQDHVTEFEDRYTESRNDDGTITHTPVEGEIIQQGTPQNATNFNHMEEEFQMRRKQRRFWHWQQSTSSRQQLTCRAKQKR